AAQVDRQVHALVELRRRGGLEQLHRLAQAVAARRVGRLQRRLHPLAAPHQPSTTSMPIERAVPAMMFIAESMSFALRSGSLSCAISRSWARVTVPTLLRLGSPDPFSTLAARLSRTAAGGVFSSKVKLRSA